MNLSTALMDGDKRRFLKKNLIKLINLWKTSDSLKAFPQPRGLAL
jgi:hypothetical protein